MPIYKDWILMALAAAVFFGLFVILTMLTRVEAQQQPTNDQVVIGQKLVEEINASLQCRAALLTAQQEIAGLKAKLPKE